MDTIDVVLHVWVDPQSGAHVILPDEKDIEQIRLEMRLAASYGDSNTRSELESMTDKQVERLRQARDMLLSHAQVRRYTVRLPSYGEYLEAEQRARNMDADGNFSTDMHKLMEILLPKSLVDLSPEDVRALRPNVAAAIWQKLYAALWPDPSRLPFYALLQETYCRPQAEQKE